MLYTKPRMAAVTKSYYAESINMPVKIDSSNLNSKAGLTKTQSGSRSSGGAFVANLKDARVAIFDGNMKELIEVVKARGDQFVKSPDETLLNSYKESIKMFLKKIKDEFLSLKEEFGTKKDGEQKVYQLVETSEHEVAELTRETLTESKAMGLLASLDDIRGLVLDIMG